MSQLPVSKQLVYPIEIFHNTTDYWESINPIIAYMKGAHDVDRYTLKIGDGKTRYLDLEARSFLNTTNDDGVMLATENDPGMVSNLASEQDIKNSVGDGAVRSKYIETIIESYRNKLILDQVSVRNIGDRYLHPSDQIPLDAVKADGSTIAKSDKRYAVLHAFLKVNPDQVITETEWTIRSNTANGVGGVAFYCYKSNGDIRLPDERAIVQCTVSSTETVGDTVDMMYN